MRRSPALARLAAAELVSPLGDAMATVAVILHLQDRGGSGTTVALVLFAEAVPTVLAPFAGALADRVADRRRLLAAAALAQAAVVASIAAALPRVPLAVLAVLLFVRAALDTASSPALGAIVPDVVDDDDLERANSVVAAMRELGTVLGPPLAGLLFAATSASWVLAADAVTFVAVAPLFLLLPASSRDPAPTARWRDDAAAGIRFVVATPRLRAIAVGFWILVFFTAPDDLVLAFLGRDTFGAEPFTVGLLLAGASVGLVLATPVVHVVARRLGSASACIVAGALTMVAGNALTAVAPAVGFAFLAQAVRGAGIPLYDAAGVRAAVQREVAPALRGRALANVYGGVGVAAALGYLAGGPVLDATSPRAAFGLVAAGGVGGVLVTGLLVRGTGERPSV